MTASFFIGAALTVCSLFVFAQPSGITTSSSVMGTSTAIQPVGSVSSPNTSQSVSSATLPRAEKFESIEKPVDQLARALGVVGLLLSLCGFALSVYNVFAASKKIKRDRLLSIDDDYWFRKIITPATIEPMLKSFVDILRVMPSRESPADEKQQYSLKVTTEFQALYTSVQSLALFNEDLPSEVSHKLRECEDIVMEYCLAISVDAPPATTEQQAVTQSIDDVRAAAWKQLTEVVKVIRNRQLAH